jgi:hypothetical protein
VTPEELAQLAADVPSLAEIDAEIARRLSLKETDGAAVQKALAGFSRETLCRELAARSAKEWGQGKGYHWRTAMWAFQPHPPAQESHLRAPRACARRRRGKWRHCSRTGVACGSARESQRAMIGGP